MTYDLLNQPKTIAEALAAGSKTYWSGRPCKKGHLAPRWTCSSTCLTCHKEKNNSPEAAATRKRRFAENPEALERKREQCRRCHAKRWQNPEIRAKKLEKNRAWQSSERGRELEKLRWRRNRQDPTKGLKEYKRDYERRRLREDADHRLRNALRCAHRRMIRAGAARDGKTEELLGCSYDELRQYLEAQFQEGMTWDNWGKGGWEVDHKKPLALYDLTDPEQYREAAHYTNLQPLWESDNRRKGARWVDR